MDRIVAITLISAALFVSGCNRNTEQQPAQPTPAPEAAQAAAPTPPPVQAAQAPEAEQANQDAQVIVLCYHRFEGSGFGSLSIAPETFEQQLQALKDGGIEVISMQDFLAWKRNEKRIPPRSAIITIDDGYVSGYSVAWPILKKYGYPFTMFVYTKFINTGGKSISWEQLEEMRDAGVEIGSHTVSHDDLRSKKGKTPEQYTAWLQEEMAGSKKILEDRLGIRVTTLAFPYGNHNEEVRKVGMEAGYEAMFSVYGQKIGFGTPSDMVGRYAIEEKKPEIYKTAITFSGGSAPAQGPAVTQLAAGAMITQPMEGETVTTAAPMIKANLATFGEIDPASVQMRLSGIGIVPATFDPQTKTLSYQVSEKLKDSHYTVIVSAKAANGAKRLETRWSFSIQPQ